MKISRARLGKIVKEELQRAKKRKTIRISERKLRKMIRQECSDLNVVEQEVIDDDGGCGCGQSVDKHGALANPLQEPLQATPEVGYMHPEPMLGMEEIEDEDDDLLLGF